MTAPLFNYSCKRYDSNTKEQQKNNFYPFLEVVNLQKHDRPNNSEFTGIHKNHAVANTSLSS